MPSSWSPPLYFFPFFFPPFLSTFFFSSFLLSFFFLSLAIVAISVRGQVLDTGQGSTLSTAPLAHYRRASPPAGASDLAFPAGTDNMAAAEIHVCVGQNCDR